MTCIMLEYSWPQFCWKDSLIVNYWRLYVTSNCYDICYRTLFVSGTSQACPTVMILVPLYNKVYFCRKCGVYSLFQYLPGTNGVKNRSKLS